MKICNRRARELCNKAAKGIYYHGKCDDSKNAFLFSGSNINTYLQSFGLRYGVDSNNGITTVANAMDEDKAYYVCANYKQRIIDAVDTRRKSSVQLNPQARIPIVITDKTTLRVVFDFDNGQEEYKEVTYDDELEEDKDRFS